MNRINWTDGRISSATSENNIMKKQTILKSAIINKTGKKHEQRAYQNDKA